MKNKTKKRLLQLVPLTVIACSLSFVVIDFSVDQFEDHYAYSFDGRFSIAQAHARETRAERRARIKQERLERREYRLNGGREGRLKAEAQAIADAEAAASATVVEKIDTTLVDKSGPASFSDDMVDFLDLPPVVKKEAPVEVTPTVAEVKDVEEKKTSRRRSKRERGSGRSKRNKSKTETAATTSQAMRGEVYTELEKAQNLFQAKSFDEAIAILDKLSAQTGKLELQAYEKANVDNFYAFIFYSQQKYEQAITFYRKVLSQPDLPKAMKDKTQFTLAQLQMVREDYPAAITEFEKWLKTAEKPGPDVHATLSQAYVQVKDYDNALAQMKKAIAAARSQGRRPNEQWFGVLRYLYNEKGQTKKELGVVKVLLKYWPQKKYWMGLAGLLGQSGDTEKQMEILNALYAQNSLENESELVSLAQMFAGMEVPYKAAKIMERGFAQKKIKRDNKNLERTGEYWRQAYNMEKALPLLEAASKNAPDGKSSERLAYIYYGLSKFKESASAAQRAIAKGGLRDVNGVRMLAGQALFNAEQFDAASAIFKRVYSGASDPSQKNMAEQWLGYMEREKIRIKEVKQYLRS